MNQVLLLVLLTAFCGLTAMRAVLVYRRTGINPVKFKAEDSVYGTLNRVLKVSLATWLFIGLVYAFAPGMKPWLAPIDYLETGAVYQAGVFIAAVAIVWISIAQAQMSASFRMGVDPSERTALVHRGLFRISRNPIYVGLLAGVGGFFLTAPNVLSFGAAVAALIGISVQVRLEEEYLLSKHGAAYREYQATVRRWMGTRRGQG